MESANHVSVSVLVAAFNVEKYIERCLQRCTKGT